MRPRCKPGSATFPLPGIGADIVDDDGRVRRRIPGGGYLVLTRPWPSMLRGIWGDPERYRDTYWCRFDGRYFAGDGAKRDDDGYFWLLGRVDDVMLVVGPQHLDRRGRARARRRTRRSPRPRSSGATDATTGQAISAFVILRGGNEPSDALVAELRDHVGAHTSARSPSRRRSSSPRTCPKTRSGKIMRRLLRDVAEDQALGDTTTLADPSVVEGIKARYLAAATEDD